MYLIDLLLYLCYIISSKASWWKNTPISGVSSILSVPVTIFVLGFFNMGSLSFIIYILVYVLLSFLVKKRIPMALKRFDDNESLNKWRVQAILFIVMNLSLVIIVYLFYLWRERV